MNKIPVAIIGAGQLGSRHLQGVLATKQNLEVYIIDPSDSSLDLAKTRASEIKHENTLHFYTELAQLPAQLELVIVATNSNVRATVVTQLLEISNVRYLLLEKVLFQCLDEYNAIQQLLEKKGVKTWVNYPRREQRLYQEIKNKLEEAGSAKTSFSVYGQNWGIGCNALHFLDLFVCLANSELVELNTTGLDKRVIPSKRKGFVEFSGMLAGTLANGSNFTITSIFDKSEKLLPLTVNIFTPKLRYIVQEGAVSTVLELEEANDFKLHSYEDNLLFQSELTTTLAEKILVNGTCNLPSYSEATHTHKAFIQAMLSFYNKETNTNLLACPIT